MFDRPIRDLDAIMRDFTRIERMKSGASFSLAETDPDRLYRLSGDDEDLALTIEYCNWPAKPEAFRQALASPFTEIVTPDIRDRLARAQSHILLDVSHEAMASDGDDAERAARSARATVEHAGATSAQFHRRLAVLALITRVITEHAMPLAVDWSQSGLLVSGEMADNLAAMESPGPLHIRPHLFSSQPALDETGIVGIRTFGARHWLGREILIRPNLLPWATNYDAILAFVRAATMADHDIIRDGNTFGSADGQLSYRVLRHDAGANLGHETEIGTGTATPASAGIPIYELVPIKYVADSHAAPDHVVDDNAFNGRVFAVATVPTDQDTSEPKPSDRVEKHNLSSRPRPGPRIRVFGRKGV